jgi:HSP20 family protein
MTQAQQRQGNGGASTSERTERSDALTRWLGDLALPRWFPDIARGLFDPGQFGTTRMLPRVEEFVEGNEMVVRAELPGIDPERDVEITVNDNSLRIRAERREEQRDESEGYRTEFFYGLFERILPLPAGVDEEQVRATYRDGILEVRVPIDQQRAEAKRITVDRG